MRALSVRQPWAELILSGRKRYELRSWKPPVLGRILIHASARMDANSALRAGLEVQQLATGALLGSVEVTGSVPFTPALAASMRLDRAHFANWEPGLCAWVLKNPIRFRDPIPFKGRLGVFHVLDLNVTSTETEGAPARDVYGNAPRSTTAGASSGAHFVQYHNSAQMGYGCSEIDAYRIITRRPLTSLENRVLGNTVWLIAGEGNPRRYFLCLTFTADEVGHVDSNGFDAFVAGKHGRRFVGVRLDSEAWFAQFKAGQGNFAFGLNKIADEFVPYFEDLAKAAETR